jgi:hypothetical protein
MAERDSDPAGAALTHDIDHLTSDILGRWRQQLRRREDERPRSGNRGESEQLLVATLLRASASKDDSLLPALAAAAARYGAEQRRARLDPGGLCDELSLLRHIVWEVLKLHGANVNDAVDRILRFDQSLSIVVKAAVTAGYAEKIPAAESPCGEEKQPQKLRGST